MNKNRIRRYTGLLVHYWREFRAAFGKPAAIASFTLSVLVICFLWGPELVSFLERTGGLDNAPGIEAFLELTLTVANAFLALYILMYALIFYQRSQRQEMLNVLAWPAEKECFGMLKLLDGNMNLILAASLLVPGVVSSYAGCSSLEDVLRITACFGLLCSHALASYIIAALFMSLAGAVYIRIPSQKPRFPLFLLLWMVIGFWLVAFSYAPFWGCEQYVEMLGTAWAKLWAGLICSGAKGSAAVILAAGIGLLILLRLALTIIGMCYVENIQKLDDAITAAQKSITAQFDKPVLRYLPLMSRQVQSVWFKDLKIVTQQHTMIVSVFISILFCIFFGMRNNESGGSNSILLLGTDFVSLVAVIGATIFQIFSTPVFGIEGSEGESLVPYPVRARQILMGKTLCVVTLHLPIFLLFIASVIYSGFSGDRIASFLLWSCWLFPLSLSHIAVGGWLKVVPGYVGESKSTVAQFLGLPVSIGFIILYYILLLLGKSVHWLFYPAGCLACLGLYYVIAGQVVHVLPGLSVWGDRAKKEKTETFATVIGTDIFKICLATIPVFLIYAYISAGFRPMRYFPTDLRDVFYIVPILAAFALFKIRISRWIRCILVGCLLFAMAGVVVLHKFDPNRPIFVNIVFYPEKIYKYLADSSDNYEDYEARLPEHIAKKFGYDHAMTLDEIYQTPPPERLAEFLADIKGTEVFYEIHHNGESFKKWIADSVSKIPDPERMDIWLNTISDNKNKSYNRFFTEILFNPEDWTSETVSLLTDSVFRNFNTERFQKIYINLDILPFKKLKKTEARKLVQIFKDEIAENSSFVEKLDTALQSYARYFKVDDSGPLCLKILALLPGADAFDTMQELLYKNQTASGIRMPSFKKLITGKRRPRLRRLKKLWQEYPEYAAFLSVKHPRLSENIIAIKAMPRFTKASKNILELVEKTIRIRNRDGEITRYIKLSGGASAFHGKVSEAKTLLCMAIPKTPGFLAKLNLNSEELAEICQCLWKLPHEDACLLMALVEESPRSFAAKKINWDWLLQIVQPDEYVDFGVTLLSNGAFFDIIVPMYAEYNFPKDNPQYKLIESFMERLSEPRWHGSLLLSRKRPSRLIHRPYVLLLKYKGTDAAISFLQTIGPPLQKDIRVLTDVLTHGINGEGTDISSIYDYWMEPGGYPSKFVQEALIRALLEKGEKDEAEFLVREKNFSEESLAHVLDFSEKPGKKISGGFFLTALGYTLLFVLVSATLRLIPRLRKKNSG
ncbi:MAG: hypothetical protein GY795_43960 [Desulfobacterales bacterium]|nr:hypothetical protein [Desulfobacterales bacterium]